MSRHLLNTYCVPVSACAPDVYHVLVVPASTRRLTADKESEAQRGRVIDPASQSRMQREPDSVLVADTEHMQESEEATTNL